MHSLRDFEALWSAALRARVGAGRCVAVNILIGFHAVIISRLRFWRQMRGGDSTGVASNET
jgi:hypothetical protein